MQVAAGNEHTMYLMEDGSLWGMGENFHGRLGDGTSQIKITPVQIVSGGVVQVAAGEEHTM